MNSPANVSSATTPTLPVDLTDRIRQLRDALLTGLVERDVAIRLALIAALAGEHVLLVGPPGTAKSLVAARLHLAFAESTYFERLLTRFTVPEELFGPLSIKGLEEDRYERLLDRYLPTASVAFLDEIFKANSAILNALLTLLNERKFDNGVNRIETPLIAVIGASNELPEDEELAALFDRFLLRLHVGAVSKSGFPALLGLRGNATPVVPDDLKLTAADLAAVQRASEEVIVTDDVVNMLSQLRDWCTAESIPVSDRRWRKIVKLLQVSALTNGRDMVSVWDCWLLQHCLWDKPEDRAKVYKWYGDRAGTSAAMDPSLLKKVVVTMESGLKADQDQRSQRIDDKGRPLFKGPDGKATPDSRGPLQANRGNDPLFLAPPNMLDARHRQMTDRTNGGAGFTRAELDAQYLRDGIYGGLELFAHSSGREAYLTTPSNHHMVDTDLPPLLAPTVHKYVHVQHCLTEIDRLRANVLNYQSRLDERIASLNAEITSHLWVTPDFAGPASATLKQTQGEVATLLTRIDKLRTGYAALPCEPAPAIDPDASAFDKVTDKRNAKTTGVL